MLNDFLYFTRTERIGILVLAILILILLILPVFLPDRSEHDPSDFTALAARINEREASFAGGKSSKSDAQSVTTKEAPLPFSPNEATSSQLEAVGLSKQSVRAWTSYLRKGGQFYHWEDVSNFRALSEEERRMIRPYLIFSTAATDAENEPNEQQIEVVVLESFDPNRVEEAQLLAMGVPPKAASNWLKFLSSGGHFRQATDIQKVYGLPDATAEVLLPYVQIMEASPMVATEQPAAYEAVNTNIIIDVNKATAAQWQELKGVGPAYSNRIVNFRDKLGGFISIEQVAETYGLPDSVFQAIYLQLRPSAIFRPLSINQLGIAELASHPYLSKTTARSIVQYREEHGSYKSAADLDKLYGLGEEVKKKIIPYLVFE